MGKVLLKIMKILSTSYVYFIQELSTILFKKKKKSVTINSRTNDKKKERERERGRGEKGGRYIIIADNKCVLNCIHE